MEGAVQLCNSLQYQQHLRHLDISFNSLGSEGGLALGTALLDNHVSPHFISSSLLTPSISSSLLTPSISSSLLTPSISLPLGHRGALDFK
jgi:hypothetical protein